MQRTPDSGRTGRRDDERRVAQLRSHLCAAMYKLDVLQAEQVEPFLRLWQACHWVTTGSEDLRAYGKPVSRVVRREHALGCTAMSEQLWAMLTPAGREEPVVLLDRLMAAANQSLRNERARQRLIEELDEPETLYLFPKIEIEANGCCNAARAQLVGRQLDRRDYLALPLPRCTLPVCQCRPLRVRRLDVHEPLQGAPAATLNMGESWPRAFRALSSYWQGKSATR